MPAKTVPQLRYSFLDYFGCVAALAVELRNGIAEVKARNPVNWVTINEDC